MDPCAVHLLDHHLDLPGKPTTPKGIQGGELSKGTRCEGALAQTELNDITEDVLPGKKV